MHFPASCLARLLRAGFALALATMLFAPTAAQADPIEAKRAEAEGIARQLEAQTERVSTLAEEFNAARLEAERVAAAVVEAERIVAVARERLHAVQSRLRRQAADAYVQGGAGASVALLLGTGAEGKTLPKLDVRATYVRTATAAALETLDVVRDERATFDENRARLVAAREEAERTVQAVSAGRAEAEAAAREQQAVLARVRGELADLVAAEQRRRAEEEARRVRAEMEARQRREQAAREQEAREQAARQAAAQEAARTATTVSRRPQQPTPSPSGAPSDAGSGPAASGASAAVEEARRQLGKPYEWGAAGPDSFDCSGLTQWSWKAGGKSLPHSSRAQYSATSRVAVPNLKPGDLLFFGPSVSGIHHVGIYVGDGQMIEASRAGTPVRYASIYRRDLVGAGRVN